MRAHPGMAGTLLSRVRRSPLRIVPVLIVSAGACGSSMDPCCGSGTQATLTNKIVFSRRGPSVIGTVVMMPDGSGQTLHPPTRFDFYASVASSISPDGKRLAEERRRARRRSRPAFPPSSRR